MRKIALLIMLLGCFLCPMAVMATDAPISTEPVSIEPVSIETLNQKIDEAEQYFMDTASPIIKLLSKIMLVFIVFSFLGVLFTGAGAARNAFIAMLFVGIGLVIFTAVPQISDWFIKLGVWLTN